MCTHLFIHLCVSIAPSDRSATAAVHHVSSDGTIQKNFPPLPAPCMQETKDMLPRYHSCSPCRGALLTGYSCIGPTVSRYAFPHGCRSLVISHSLRDTFHHPASLLGAPGCARPVLCVTGMVASVSFLVNLSVPLHSLLYCSFCVLSLYPLINTSAGAV